MSSIESSYLYLFYLVVVADGRYSDEEFKKMKQLCEEQGFDEYDKRRALYKCVEMLFKNDGSTLYSDFMKEYDDYETICEADKTNQKWERKIAQCAEIESIIKYLPGKIKEDDTLLFVNYKKAHMQVILKLFDVAYADQEYSWQEKVVMSTIMDVWNIERTVLEDIEDTEETICVLQKQKEWIKKASTSLQETTVKNIEIDKIISRLKSNLNYHIADTY